MIVLVTIIHIVVCFFIIIVVLLQSGQSGDITAAFGGMGSQTAFGPRGAASLLGRLTTWAAVLFMCTSIVLSIFAARRPRNSVLEGVRPSGQTQQQPAPANRPTPAPNPLQ